MSRKVIAVDFDDTLFTNNWPSVGDPIWPVINRAKEEQANGAAIILWTCRIGESLDAAVDACKRVGLTPDAVNETLPEWLAEWVDDPRKIGATEYWDDRAVNVKSPWIPVTERLPEDDLPVDSQRQQLKVLVAIRNEKGKYTIRTQTRVRQKAYYHQPRSGRWYWGKHSYGDVTHWMPLPEVPV